MPPAFRVVAILATYNEADIIEHVVRDLIDQGVEVHLLDDGSTDNTVALVEPYLGRGVRAIERLPAPRSDEGFAWERILRRKQEVAVAIDADWCIHHDADEFRESPWVNIPLRDAVERVDALGFNAIDFASLDFWPVVDSFQPGGDVRDALTSYTDAALYDRVQIRAWKQTRDLDLTSSGGHEARFPGRSVFPIRFISRHYPVRGQAHGERKLFRERRDRFPDHERARGWHVQYDTMREGESLVRRAETLRRYDADAVRISLALRHRGIEALESAVECRDRAVEHAQAETESTRGALAEATLDVARLSTQLDATRVVLAERTAALATCSGEVAVREEALGERAAVIASLQQSVRELAQRINAIHRSRSWRWMAPARAVFRILGGR